MTGDTDERDIDEIDRAREVAAKSSAAKREAEIDAELLDRWQRDDDHRAADALLVRYYKVLRRFFVNKVPRDLVDDLVQETFLECLGALKTFEGRASLRTFIILIAKRRCYKYYRTRDRKLAHLDPLEDSVEAMSTGLFTKLARQLDQRLLLTALRRIPLKYQTAIELFYWEGLSIREASEVLDGMNERTFRTWLRVGKEKLMEELSRDGVTDEMRRESFRALRTMQAEVKTEGAA